MRSMKEFTLIDDDIRWINDLVNPDVTSTDSGFSSETSSGSEEQSHWMLAEDLILDQQAFGGRGVQDNLSPVLMTNGAHIQDNNDPIAVPNEAQFASRDVARRQTRATVGDTAMLLESSMEWDLTGQPANKETGYKGKGKEPMVFALPTNLSELENVVNDTGRSSSAYSTANPQTRGPGAKRTHVTYAKDKLGDTSTRSVSMGVVGGPSNEAVGNTTGTNLAQRKFHRAHSHTHTLTHTPTHGNGAAQVPGYASKLSAHAAALRKVHTTSQTRTKSLHDIRHHQQQARQHPNSSQYQSQMSAQTHTQPSPPQTQTQAHAQVRSQSQVRAKSRAPLPAQQLVSHSSTGVTGKHTPSDTRIDIYPKDGTSTQGRNTHEPRDVVAMETDGGVPDDARIDIEGSRMPPIAHKNIEYRRRHSSVLSQTSGSGEDVETLEDALRIRPNSKPAKRTRMRRSSSTGLPYDERRTSTAAQRGYISLGSLATTQIWGMNTTNTTNTSESRQLQKKGSEVWRKGPSRSGLNSELLEEFGPGRTLETRRLRYALAGAYGPSTRTQGAGQGSLPSLASDHSKSGNPHHSNPLLSSNYSTPAHYTGPKSSAVSDGSSSVYGSLGASSFGTDSEYLRTGRRPTGNSSVGSGLGLGSALSIGGITLGPTSSTNNSLNLSAGGSIPYIGKNNSRGDLGRIAALAEEEDRGSPKVKNRYGVDGSSTTGLRSGTSVGTLSSGSILQRLSTVSKINPAQIIKKVGSSGSKPELRGAMGGGKTVGHEKPGLKSLEYNPDTRGTTQQTPTTAGRSKSGSVSSGRNVDRGVSSKPKSKSKFYTYHHRRKQTGDDYREDTSSPNSSMDRTGGFSRSFRRSKLGSGTNLGSNSSLRRAQLNSESTGRVTTKEKASKIRPRSHSRGLSDGNNPEMKPYTNLGTGVSFAPGSVVNDRDVDYNVESGPGMSTSAPVVGQPKGEGGSHGNGSGRGVTANRRQRTHAQLRAKSKDRRHRARSSPLIELGDDTTPANQKGSKNSTQKNPKYRSLRKMKSKEAKAKQGDEYEMSDVSDSRRAGTVYSARPEGPASPANRTTRTTNQTQNPTQRQRRRSVTAAMESSDEDADDELTVAAMLK